MDVRKSWLTGPLTLIDFDQGLRGTRGGRGFESWKGNVSNLFFSALRITFAACCPPIQLEAQSTIDCEFVDAGASGSIDAKLNLVWIKVIVDICNCWIKNRRSNFGCAEWTIYSVTGIFFDPSHCLNFADKYFCLKWHVRVTCHLLWRGNSNFFILNYNIKVVSFFKKISVGVNVIEILKFNNNLNNQQSFSYLVNNR